MDLDNSNIEIEALKKELGNKNTKSNAINIPTEESNIEEKMEIKDLTELEADEKIDETPEGKAEEKDKMERESNSNINNVSSELSELSNLDIFANTDGVIKVSEKELVPEYERVYADDAIYIGELENEYISELPLTQQNDKYLQEKISEKVRHIIELKNEGIRLLARDDKYSYILDNFKSQNFNKTNWIIPVVLDKQKIYQYLDVEPETTTPTSISTSISEPEPESESKSNSSEYSIEVNLKDELAKYDKLFRDYSYGNISLFSFEQQSSELIRPFVIADKYRNIDVGYKMLLKGDTNLLRYYHLNTPHWDERIGLGPTFTNIDKMDDNKRIKLTERKILASGEKINIIGFVILPRNGGQLNSFQLLTQISAIEPGEKTIIITATPHKLISGDFIIIRNNDYLNGQYEITVIDNTKFTIEFDSSDTPTIAVSLPLGEIFSNIKIAYNIYHIKKDKDVIAIQKVETAGDNAPALYLFDTFNISDVDYIKILELVVPSIDRIMEREGSAITETGFLSEINQILTKYILTYNEFDISQFDVIKKVMAEHLEKSEASKDSIKRIEPKIEKLDTNGTLYADTLFYAKDIIAVYGLYPLRDTQFDTLLSRMKWIDAHRDSGDYYYNYVLAAETTNIDSIADIKKTVKSLQDILKDIVGKKPRTEADEAKCSKYVKQYANKNEMEKDETKYSEGDFAVIPITVAGRNEGELYVYKKGKWIFLRTSPAINNISKLCMLSAEEIKDLTEIECQLVMDGCMPRKLVQYNEKVKSIEQAINNYQALSDTKTEYTDELKNKIEYAVIQLGAQIGENTKSENKNKNKNTNKNKRKVSKIGKVGKEIPFTIVKILYDIGQIRDEYAKKYLMYRLLERDGILIGEVVYSKKYQGYLMCGHWTYLYRMDYSNNNDMKNVILGQMLARFGDSGAEDHSEQSCKICGGFLTHRDYDESMGFDEHGNPDRMRDIWVDEDKEAMEKRAQLGERINCRDQNYRTELTTRGLSIEQMDESVKLCVLLQGFLKKMGVQLFRTDFITIVMDVIRKYTALPDYALYRKKSIISSKARGISDDKIRKLDEQGVFKEAFLKFNILRRYTLAIARLLVTLQTAVPPYKIRKGLTGCTLTDISARYGVEYVSCILHEMRVIERRDIRLGDIMDDMSRVLETYNDDVDIKKLYALREQYDRAHLEEQKRRTDGDVSPFLDMPLAEVETSAPTKQFVLGSTRDILYAESVFNARMAIGILNSTVAKMPPALELTEIANSVSIELIRGYRYNIVINEADKRYDAIIVEGRKLDGYRRLFIDAGSITKMFSIPARQDYTNNHPVSYYSLVKSATNTKIIEELVRSKFLNFCYKGQTRGQSHYFIGTGKTRQCAKCNVLLSEIMEGTFDSAEFKKLLDDIAQLHMTFVAPGETKEDIPGEIPDNIETYVERFVDKLAKQMGRGGDKSFRAKYAGLLNALGDYQNTYSMLENKDKTDKENNKENNTNSITISSIFQSIKLMNNKEGNRIQLLKTYINQYFRRFISMIGNGYNFRNMNIKIPYVASDVSRDLQKYIYDDYEKLGKFYNVEYQDIFVGLKFRHSINDVNKIYGKSDRFDCAWEKIISASKFTLKNAADVLMYILLEQLGEFMTDLGKPMGEFIMAVFDIILEDTAIFDMSAGDIDKFKNNVAYYQYCRYEKSINLGDTIADKQIIRAQFMELGTDVIDEDGKVNIYQILDNEPEMEATAIQAEVDEADIETLARETLGMEAGANAIETFKENYYKEKRNESDVYREFNMVQPKEGVNIIEVGDSYGESEQGVEDSGNGISDYTMAEWDNPM